MLVTDASNYTALRDKLEKAIKSSILFVRDSAVSRFVLVRERAWLTQFCISYNAREGAYLKLFSSDGCVRLFSGNSCSNIDILVLSFKLH